MGFKRSIPVLLTGLAAALPAFGAEYALENNQLGRRFSVNDGLLVTESIINKVSGSTVQPSSSDGFRLRVSDGVGVEGTDRILKASDFKVYDTEQRTGTDSSSLVFHLRNPQEGLDVEVTYSQKGDEPYIRKQLHIAASKEVTIERVDIDSLSLSGVYQPYQKKAITTRSPANWKPGLGQPLYTRDSALFIGTEFPASYNYVEDGQYFAGYQYGHKLNSGDSFSTYQAVLGAGDDSAYITDTFFEYIDSIRVRPLRLQTQYNSWFDYGSGVDKQKFERSVDKVHDELSTIRQVPALSSYVIDDGWQQRNGNGWSNKVWPVNSKFNSDFAYSLDAVKRAESTLGLWMSPGCLFGCQSNIPFMKNQGWGVLDSYMSMANTEYMRQLEQRMLELTREGVSYFKLDGIFGHLNNREFDINGAANGVPVMPNLTSGLSPSDSRLNSSVYDEAKIYYLTVGAERLIKIFDQMAKVNPDVYIVISNGAWLSPWWLMHIDSVWMINAGDAAGGSNRTQELVYRDGVYHQIWSQENTQFPMNALFNHEPKKTANNETKDTFRKYLYMNMSRGTGFIELYIKPFNLAEYDWDVMAEGMLWARDVFPTFKRVRMHGGNPKSGDVYGYTAWLDNRGYVSLHNPSSVEKSYTFTLDRSFGLKEISQEYFLTSPLSDSLDGLDQSYSYGDTITVSLAPREVRILNFDTVAKDWTALRNLQTRTKDDYNKGINPQGSYIGTWKYTYKGQPYSREFDKEGYCTLRQGDNEIWSRPYQVINDKKVIVNRNEVHVIGDDNIMRFSSYEMVKQVSELHLGVWEYTYKGKPYSREFDKEGYCTLRQGGRQIWRRAYEVVNDRKVIVNGNEVHIIGDDNIMRFASYEMVKQ